MIRIPELKSKLLPCLHCGNTEPDEFHQDTLGDCSVGDQYLIECSCGIGSVVFAEFDKIVADWNRRPKEWDLALGPPPAPPRPVGRTMPPL